MLILDPFVFLHNPNKGLQHPYPHPLPVMEKTALLSSLPTTPTFLLETQIPHKQPSASLPSASSCSWFFLIYREYLHSCHHHPSLCLSHWTSGQPCMLYVLNIFCISLLLLPPRWQECFPSFWPPQSPAPPINPSLTVSLFHFSNTHFSSPRSMTRWLPTTFKLTSKHPDFEGLSQNDSNLPFGALLFPLLKCIQTDEIICHQLYTTSIPILLMLLSLSPTLHEMKYCPFFQAHSQG